MLVCIVDDEVWRHLSFSLKPAGRRTRCGGAHSTAQSAQPSNALLLPINTRSFAYLTEPVRLPPSTPASGTSLQAHTMRPGLLFAALLALAATASAGKYASREEYAKENEFEVRWFASRARGAWAPQFAVAG